MTDNRYMIMQNRPRKLLTLCIVRRDGNVLLGMKKRGFGAGHWNGFGGKVEEGETIGEAARREMREEAGIEATVMHQVGTLDFEFQNDPKILEVHVFKVDDFSGDPVETEEMRPQWFAEADIPYDQMWSDDIHWLPMLLRGASFKGRFLFDQPSSSEYVAKIVEQELIEISGK